MAILKPIVFMGIDPGLDGALVVISGTKIVASRVVPIIAPFTTKKSKTKKRDYNLRGMVEIVNNIKKEYTIALTVLEKGRAMPGQGVTSMFRFGMGCGIWIGILSALNIPFIEVVPSVWHKTICAGISGDAKIKAYHVASNRFPNNDFTKSNRARTPHSGKVDATCIALYAKNVFGFTTELDEAYPPEEIVRRAKKC